MYELYDVVTITINKPNGGTGGHFEKTGVVMEIKCEEDEDNYSYNYSYRVTDVIGDSYWYLESELRPVGVRELENAFVSVIKHFVDRR